MSLRALILDDEPPARDYLAELLSDTGDVEVVAAVATAKAARQALEGSLEVDVMFVDVQLVGSGGNEDGIDLVRSLGRQGPAVVLATAHKQHALEAFELGVLDYLHKPFTRERVASCVRRLREQRKPPGQQVTPISRIVARQQRSLVFIELDSVFAFEADDRLTYVHAVEGKFDFDLPLSSIEATFGETIVRVHRNWLVNLALVRQIERGDGETALLIGSRAANVPPLRVPVARERAARVRELLLANAAGVRRA
ncbi:LytTR family DNA-binding domain-containing protein [Corallococcus sp. bb12-1]|uniref:LytR/AlgR family response regulator transcription factor n=1 Tax=Corallococcus sp. bb12-1 TaxID=2996784 RepID=UPI002270EBB3|nr:LytTR family DNA-binding domain-containing protein [Corallococcus sp. bb12-1]MCY1041542.1 LytTR family DNA-binding domain-containing protein [Corallococcus sp. bb12-1]